MSQGMATRMVRINLGRSSSDPVYLETVLRNASDVSSVLIYVAAGYWPLGLFASDFYVMWYIFVYLGIAYSAVVYGLNKGRVHLRNVNIAWNVLWGTVSAMTCIALLLALYGEWKDIGFTRGMCLPVTRSLGGKSFPIMLLVLLAVTMPIRAFESLFAIAHHGRVERAQKLVYHVTAPIVACLLARTTPDVSSVFIVWAIAHECSASWLYAYRILKAVARAKGARLGVAVAPSRLIKAAVAAAQLVFPVGVFLVSALDTYKCIDATSRITMLLTSAVYLVMQYKEWDTWAMEAFTPLPTAGPLNTIKRRIRKAKRE